MKEVYEFLKSCGTYYLATLDEDDQPRVRPFGTVMIYEDRLYIQTGKSKNVSQQIQKHPKVELCGFQKGQWLRLSGTLVRDENTACKEALLADYPGLKDRYSATDDNMEVLYFQDATAVFSSFTSPDKIIHF